MPKRRLPTQKEVEAAKTVKRKRIVNNNEHEDSEDESDNEVERGSVSSISSQLSGVSASQIPFSRCGKVLTVKLRNFMCHENLTVDFNSNANLLIGKNGSGKSAVLTALIIGLGCKANATNRSSSIKQLIKTGETSATIEVHLSNNGFDCYERDKYGDKIVVIRQIAASGSSTYKMKSSRGEVISTKRADLLKMIFYMNIQVDNPVCVLTQDAARGFLRDSDPKKRYQLFLKATQLDIICEKLSGCTEQLRSAKSSLNVQREHSDELKKRYDEARIHISRLNSVNPIKEEILQHKCAKKWCTVASEENLVREITNTLETVNTKKDNLMRKTQNRENDEGQLNEKLAQINGSIDVLMQSSNEHRQRYEAKKASHRESNDRMAEQVREVKRIEGKKDRIVRDIKKLEERVANDDNNEIAQLREEHRKKIAELQSGNEDAQKMMTTTERDIEMMVNNESHQKNQIGDLESQLKDIEDDIGRTNQQLRRQSQNTPMNSLQMYGAFMPSFVNDVNRLNASGKFSRKPIGPIGDMIEVKDPKYRNFIEDCCKSLLPTFLVNSGNDSMVLKQLFRTKYPQAKPISTIVMKFRDKMYDVRGKRVAKDSRFDVLMDAVTIHDPNVMNCFIDHVKADTIVFVNRFEDATHLTDRIENVPPNLSKVLLLEPYSEFFPAPTYRSYSRDLATARFLRVTSDKSEAHFTAELEKLKGKKASVAELCRQQRIKLAETVRMLKDRKTRLAKLENDILVSKRKIFALENYEYPEETEITVMTREIEAQKKILAETEAELSTAMTQKRALENEVNQIETEIKEIRQAMKSLDEDKLAKQKEKDDVQEEIQKRTNTARLEQSQMRTYNDNANKLNTELNAANEKLAKAIAIAQRAGDRPELVHSEGELDEMIKAKERKIRMIDSSNITMEQAREMFEQCKKYYEENENLIGSLQRVVAQAQASTLTRFQCVKNLKHGMITRVAYYFEKLMSLRKFKGQLKFNSDTETLDVEVIPRDRDQVTLASGTNSLSGGERSYVTVSLLMSLWKCVDHPFFFLDEYDVFTDHVNRKYLTDILLNDATKHPEFQYTFLTPQDITGIEPSNVLSIQRLSEPAR